MEESITVEETNKLRQKLGLPLIPVPEQAPNGASKDKDEPQGNGNAKSSISLEETNRIRASLGLKPIQPETEAKEDDDAVARKNWLAKVEQEQNAARSNKLAQQIQKVKDRTAKRKVLEGKSLGEDEEDENSRSWIKNFRKKQAFLRQQREVEEDDDGTEAADKAEYTSKDLSGIKVGHNVDDLMDTVGDTVLILKDKSVLDDDDEENELVSNALTAKQKVEESKKAKQGKRKFADDADLEEENKESFFVLDGQEIVSSGASKPAEKPEPASNTTKTTQVALNFDDDLDGAASANDYEQPSVSFKKRKKPKKTKAAPAKRQWKDEDEDENVRVNASNDDDDDDDLEARLLAHRRKALKLQRNRGPRSRGLTPEELAENILNDNDDKQDPDEEDGVVVSETTDFLATIKMQVNAATEGSAETENGGTEVRAEVDSAKDKMDEDQPEDMSQAPLADEPQHEEAEPASVTAVLDSGAAEEHSVSLSMADTLKLLRQRGVIDTDAEATEAQVRKQRREWARQARKEQIERELRYAHEKNQLRNAGTYNTLSQREREELSAQQNRAREREEARAAEERFRDYKPDIKLEYRDDMGNLLSSKEAFKHMSHKFHGNASGKRRVEKQLQKQEEEKQRMRESLFEAPRRGSSKSGGPGAQIA